jgi:hypothetical protein
MLRISMRARWVGVLCTHPENLRVQERAQPRALRFPGKVKRGTFCLTFVVETREVGHD